MLRKDQSNSNNNNSWKRAIFEDLVRGLPTQPVRSFQLISILCPNAGSTGSKYIHTHIRIHMCVRVFVCMCLAILAMAALDLHNKCSQVRWSISAANKLEIIYRDSLKTKTSNKKNSVAKRCCTQDSSNAHPKKLVALNYEKFHSIKTHTSRTHKKWMSIIMKSFFFVVVVFPQPLSLNALGASTQSRAIFHFRLYAKLIALNYQPKIGSNWDDAWAND